MAHTTHVERLDAKDFPLTIEVVRSSTKAFLWGATVLRPRDGKLAELFVPAASEWAGEPVYVRMTTGTGQRSISGPHDMRE